MLNDPFASFGNDPLICETDIEDAPEQRGQFASATAARQYMRAGKATVTLRSIKTGTRFTYRISEIRNEAGRGDGTLFVGLLSGSDNESSYSYLGRISRDQFWPGRKRPKPSDVSAEAPSSVAFAWTWRQLLLNRLPEQLEIWHEGRCGRCSRKLTVPESIASGFGPECIQRLS